MFLKNSRNVKKLKLSIDKSHKYVIINARKVRNFDTMACTTKDTKETTDTKEPKEAKEPNVRDTPTALLREIRAGSGESFELLVKQYAPLLGNLVSAFYMSGSGARDELEQEARSALLKAALRYDSDQTAVSFGLYAKICIRNALISHRRKTLRQSSPRISENRRTVRRQSLPEEPIDRSVLSAFSETLSPYEKKVFSAYLSGKRVAEIAEDLGRSQKSVHNALFRIREKAKQFRPGGE